MPVTTILVSYRIKKRRFQCFWGILRTAQATSGMRRNALMDAAFAVQRNANSARAWRAKAEALEAERNTLLADYNILVGQL